MAIRFRKYKNKSTGDVIQAIRLSEKNVEEVVNYVAKNGGTIVNETKVFRSENLKDGEYTAVKVAIVQRNWVGGRIKRGVRKAFGGDFIVRNLREDGKYEFWRIRDAGVDGFAPA